MDDHVRTADGLRLALHRWPLDDARGTVLIVHGLGEHAGRYAHVAAALNAAGWSALGHDHRGHGDSDGARGVIAAADSLLADLAAVIDAVRAGSPRGPLVLLGDSMGGAVAARLVAEALQPAPAAWSRPADALVLVAPALETTMTRWQRLQLALMRRLAPDVAVRSGLDATALSRDPAVVRAYLADPRVHDRISARLAQFIVDAGAFVRAHAARWRVPTLLLWGGADRIVAPSGSAAFAAAAPVGVVSAWCDPAMLHEPFNDVGREQVLQRLTGWLSTLPSPREPHAEGDTR